MVSLKCATRTFQMCDSHILVSESHTGWPKPGRRTLRRVAHLQITEIVIYPAFAQDASMTRCRPVGTIIMMTSTGQ